MSNEENDDVVEDKEYDVVIEHPVNISDEPEEDDRISDTPKGDEDIPEGETDDEKRERQERNRTRRALNKEHRKSYIESLKRELASRDAVINDLSTRVASVERQGHGSQMAQVDGAIKEAENVYNHFKNINRRAIELADGAVAVDAQEKMFMAQQRHNMLLNAKQNMTSQVNKPPPLDPRMTQHATNWMNENKWYDPTGADIDSDMVLKLDDRLHKEGWNPTTSEYWEELDARVKKYIPHRNLSVYNKPASSVKGRDRIPVSGGDDSEYGGSTKGAYHLSAARVQALKEAGVYDDPKKRADAISRYKAYDKNAGLK